MRPSFNTAGPCIPGEHYMLPPERRLGRALRLIEEHKYFTLHAGRQTGKTTSLRWLEQHLNASGAWRALWVDIETAREQPDPVRAFRSILNNFDRALARRHPGMKRPDPNTLDTLLADPSTALQEYLTRLTELDPRPLVVLVDEVDGLVGETMVSFLTQLRQGYIDRSETPFPASIVLVGQRQVRDYVVSAEDRRAIAWLGITSPFNITTEAMTLGPFSEPEVAELLTQHTETTGQRFEAEALHDVWHLGQGHPWLTNALADMIVNRDVEDRSVTVTPAHVEAAKESIILERRTHIDSLVARLREDRVRRILDPMLAGGQTADDVLDDDFAYVLGLGLIRTHAKRFEIANPIYREVIPRALTYVRQMQIATESAPFVRSDGSLDMSKLMTEWQAFWRKDGHLAADGFAYRESGPHLMLMAFLQRIVNGGGRIAREYGLGRGALDLLIAWRAPSFVENHAIEVKLRRDTETEGDGIEQVSRYLDGLGLRAGWLVLFDLRKDVSWADKLFVHEVVHDGKTISVVGC
jgi:hypothetical protein